MFALTIFFDKNTNIFLSTDADLKVLKQKKKDGQGKNTLAFMSFSLKKVF